MKDNIKYNMWSKEEIDLLISLMDSLGNNYGMMQNYFPGRTYNQIKSQYHNLRNRKLGFASGS